MGNEGYGIAYTVLAMANKDVYFLDKEDTQRLKQSLLGESAFFSFVDAKARKQITVAVSQISSVVEARV